MADGEKPQVKVDKKQEAPEVRTEAVDRDARAELAGEIRPPLEISAEDHGKIKAALEKAGAKLDRLDPETIKKIPVQQLLDAEKAVPGTLAVLFGQKLEADEKDRNKFKAIDLGSAQNYAKGDLVRFNFRGNEEAPWGVAPGDWLPAKVRQIKVIAPDGDVRTSKLRVGENGAFYDNKGFIPLDNNSRIEIVEVFTDRQLAEYREEKTQNEQADLHELGNIFHISPDQVNIEGTKLRGSARADVPDNHTENYSGEILQGNPRWHQYLDEALKANGVPPQFKYIFCFFMRIESGFKTNDYMTGSHAYGLGQMKLDTWTDAQKFMRKKINQGKMEFYGGDYTALTNSPLDERNFPEDVRAEQQIKGFVTYLVHYMDYCGLSFDQSMHNPEKIAQLYYSYHDGAGGYRQSIKPWIEANGGRIAPMPDDASNKEYMKFKFQKNRGAAGTNAVLMYPLKNMHICDQYRSKLAS